LDAAGRSVDRTSSIICGLHATLTPLIRIRSDDVTPVARLTAIAEAFDRGYELMPNEQDGMGKR
jgi:hypothetical protein